MIFCMTDWDRIRHEVAGIMSFHLLQGQESIREDHTGISIMVNVEVRIWRC